MGRLIDGKCYIYGSCKCQTAGCVIRPDNGCPVYRYFKDLILKDYEDCLKADVVAMLTEIQLEIEEMQCLYIDFVHYVNEYDVSNLIQQKINALKAESEDI